MIDLDKVKIIAEKYLKTDYYDEKDGDKILLTKIDNEKVYASVKTFKRGFGSMVIGADLTFLWGSSAVSYQKLLDEFNKGRRS